MSESTVNIFEKAIGNFQNLGRTWATAALNSTSESLKTTATFLSDLSAKLAVKEAEEAPAEADEPKN